VKDVSYIAAFPKSGITYLNYMLFQVLFDASEHTGRIDSDYIFDLHESLSRVPPAGDIPRYVKLHSPFGRNIPLRDRASRVVYLVRDPVDVMMSVWDFKHLMAEDGLLEASASEHAAKFEIFCRKWISTGGLEYSFAGSWADNVTSWLDQLEIPLLLVRYEKLKEDPFNQLRRVLQFLGRSASDDRLRAATEAGKVENMRKRETDEVTQGVSGAFYRPFLAKGYAHGFRFVGRLHQGSSEKVLSSAARNQADRVFGPVMARVRDRSDESVAAPQS
jgi:hypothetical protein